MVLHAYQAYGKAKYSKNNLEHIKEHERQKVSQRSAGTQRDDQTKQISVYP